VQVASIRWATWVLWLASRSTCLQAP